MATVVNLQKDERAGDLGKGVAGFLNRMADKRIDGLQRELMEGISSSKDEAEASALMADPRFQEVVTDNNRFGAIVTHFNNAPLGMQSLTGYDKDGNQRIVTVNEQEKPEEALRSRGLSLERSRIFHRVDPESNIDFGTSLGRFTSPTEALASIEGGLPEGQQIMDQEEFAQYLQVTNLEQSIRQRQIGLDLDSDKFQFAKDAPLTPFDNLIAAFEQGNMSANQFDQAWERLTFLGFGRTAQDVADATETELNQRGAMIASMSDQGLSFINEVLAEPRIISKVGAVTRGLENIGAELSAVSSLTGITKKSLDEYDFGGFAAQSTLFKNLLLDFAITYAATQGQSNRALSDKDFDRFLNIVGSDISNPEAFIANMDGLMRKTQRAFNIQFNRLQGFDYEGASGAFAKFAPTIADRQEALKKKYEDKYPGLIYNVPSDGVR